MRKTRIEPASIFNVWSTIIFVTMAIVSIMMFLGYQMMTSNVPSVIMFCSIIFGGLCILIVAGVVAGIIFSGISIYSTKQQDAFVNNAKENAMILAQQQRAINAMNQNKLIATQQQSQPILPAGSLIIDDSAFLGLGEPDNEEVFNLQ